PVLFLTLKGCEGRNYDFACGQVAALLQGICIEHAYLLESGKVAPADRKTLSALSDGEGTEKDMANALQVLCRALEAHWGRPAILLIDEYDVPVNYAWQNGYYDEMIALMRNMLGAALKTNASLKFAVLTGCLRIAKESIFTGLNNFRCYGISDDHFADKIGFTAKEAEELLSAADLAGKAAELKEWYDGYRFGSGTGIYCPWDVLLYIDDLQRNAAAKPKAYWNNTSGNAIVRTLIDGASQDIRGKIETLLTGGAIEEALAEDLTYDIVDKNERNLWSMLYLTGYLTRASEQPENGGTALVIPNREVRMIFTDTVSSWFKDTVAKDDLSPFVQALWNGDAGLVQETLTRILYGTISYFDSAENYYHGFMAGLMRGAGLPIFSNREKGLGRADIVIEDGYRRRAVIIELKCAGEYGELEAKAAEALTQIENRNYAAGLPPQIRKVLNYGIAFWKKESCVKVLESSR
ncbi:MAG: AAA family ATPase, partial [Desulfovibrionaceae bacterium]|nr:AAA family ATPase [Desulfovibrionaceae bacterium]